jgi:hypothetical protein
MSNAIDKAVSETILGRALMSAIAIHLTKVALAETGCLDFGFEEATLCQHQKKLD